MNRPSFTLVFAILSIWATTTRAQQPAISMKVIANNKEQRNAGDKAIQLNFLIKDLQISKAHPLQYTIVGYTDDGKIIGLEKQILEETRMIQTTVDPKETINRVGVLLTFEAEKYFFVFKAQQVLNQLLDVQKART